MPRAVIAGGVMAILIVDDDPVQCRLSTLYTMKQKSAQRSRFR